MYVFQSCFPHLGYMSFWLFGMSDKWNLECPQLTRNFANDTVDPTHYLFINVDSIKNVVNKINTFLY